MVVCKCRKATRFYCFVHKIPVCYDCVCNPEHAHCVVGLYSDWVNDGDYDWPPTCVQCKQQIEDADKSTTRLGCLHILHGQCLEKHFKAYPPYTAPAGYTCPSCSVSIWPPKSQKDAASTLYTNLRTIISKSPAASVLLGTPVPPPAFAAQPPEAALTSPAGDSTMSSLASSTISGNEVVSQPAIGAGLDSTAEDTSSGTSGPTINGRPEPLPSSSGAAPEETDGAASGPSGTNMAFITGSPGPSSKKSAIQQQQQASALAVPRKSNSFRNDRVAIDITEEYERPGDHPAYSDDDNERKYARKGSAYRQLLQHVGSLWSPALQALPVTAPPKKEDLVGEDGEGRERLHPPRRRPQQQRRSALDPRKLLLMVAIMSCMATMMLLYYRLSQASIVSAEDQGAGGQ